MTVLPLRSPQDFAAGALMSGVALAGLWFARDWATGSLAFVEAGFFPRVVCLLLLGIGLVVAARALAPSRPRPADAGAGTRPEGWAWRPLGAVTLAVVAFALLLDRAGLVVALLGLVGLANRAGEPLRLPAVAALWAAATAACVAIFAWGLGLPIRVLP